MRSSKNIAVRKIRKIRVENVVVYQAPVSGRWIKHYYVGHDLFTEITKRIMYKFKVKSKNT